LQKCVQKDGLPCIRFGRAIRFDPNAIADWVNKHNQPPGETFNMNRSA
jgi:hypothetical protein